MCIGARPELWNMIWPFQEYQLESVSSESVRYHSGTSELQFAFDDFSCER